MPAIYNAMPMEGVEKLVAFMKKFEEAHRHEKDPCINAISKYGTDQFTEDYQLTDEVNEAEGILGPQRIPS